MTVLFAEVDYRAAGSTGTTPTLTLAATPGAGDVLVVSLHVVATGRSITGVSGCGATWAHGYTANAEAPSIAVWIGTGATSAGVITVTVSSSSNGIIRGWLIPGLSSAAVAGAETHLSGSGTLTGPAQNAALGQAVLNLFASNSTSGTQVYPSTSVPASGWTTDTIGTATGHSNSAHRVPAGVAESHRLDASFTNTTSSKIVQLVLGLPELIITDSAGLTDSVSTGQLFGLTINDSAGLADQVTSGSDVSLTVTDIAGSSDAVALVSATALVITDPAGLSDSVSIPLDPDPEDAQGPQAELRVYDRDGTTLRGTVAGIGMSWVHGKGVDASSMSLTVNHLEADWTSSLLDDAIVKAAINVGGVMTEVGIPYLTAPGSGTLLGPAEGAAAEDVPVGAGALMLSAEWLVLHHGGEYKRRGERDMFYGWMSPEFDASGWEAPTVITRASLDDDAPKKNNPRGWVDQAADWIWKPSAGGLILYRAPSFTVTTARLHRICASADEEYAIYLNGERIIEESQQEVGYTTMKVWNEVLQPGDYQLAAEMTTIDSEGFGDGFDGLSVSVTTVDSQNKPNLPAIVNTGSDWVLHGQSPTAERPGLTPGMLIRIVQEENEAAGIPSAALLTRTFDDDDDSNGTPWPDLKEKSWPVGTYISQMLADMFYAVDVDCDVDLNFHAYVTQGTDLSATVALVKGSEAQAENENVIDYRHTGTAKTATRALILTERGYALYINEDVEETTAARWVYLESSQSVGIGAGLILGRDVVNEQSVVRRNYTAQIWAVAGCIPWVDFGLADTIMGYDHTGSPAPVQVVSIGCQQGDTLIFTLELAEV